MEEKIKERNFLIAEVLACLSFISNTICVITVDKTAAVIHPPNFGFFYQLKTILAAIGIFYFFYSRPINQISRYGQQLRIVTIIILLYSIPIINMFFDVPFAGIYKNFYESSFGYFGYREWIIIRIIWTLPFLIIVRDIFIKTKKSYAK